MYLAPSLNTFTLQKWGTIAILHSLYIRIIAELIQWVVKNSQPFRMNDVLINMKAVSLLT